MILKPTHCKLLKMIKYLKSASDLRSEGLKCMPDAECRAFSQMAYSSDMQ